MDLNDLVSQDRLTDEQAKEAAEATKSKYEAFQLGVVEGLGIATGLAEVIDKQLLSSPMPDTVREKFLADPEKSARAIKGLVCAAMFEGISYELESILVKTGGLPPQNGIEAILSEVIQAIAAENAKQAGAVPQGLRD